MVQNNLDDFQYMGIQTLSKYLLLKTSTIYSLVEKRKIPFYKIGRLVRFKKSDIDLWMESNRKECIDIAKETKKILQPLRVPNRDIKKVVKKAIEQSKRIDYTASHGKPDQVKGLGKEVLDGSV
jgi:excisionase family DNA binding protein